MLWSDALSNQNVILIGWMNIFLLYSYNLEHVLPVRSFFICDHNACVFSKRFFFYGVWDNGSIFILRRRWYRNTRCSCCVASSQGKGKPFNRKIDLKGLSRSNQPEEWMCCVRPDGVWVLWELLDKAYVYQCLEVTLMQPAWTSHPKKKNLGPRPADPCAIWTP